MDTQHRGKQPFGERIKAADMGHLMGQNKAPPSLPPSSPCLREEG